ncbi:MAG: NAD(P)H-dependent oxidoreductase [Maribacter sp.]
MSDRDTKQKLAKISWLNTDKVLDSDTVVVFSRINSISLFEEQIEKELPERAVNYYKEFLKPLPAEQLKAWFNRQVYLALGVFLSACAEMDIDATPMEGIEPENYDKVLDQTDYASIVAVCIGYRDQDDFNQPSKKPKSRMALSKVILSI